MRGVTERFARESLNPRLVTDSLQEGFARLGAELLPHKLPGLRVYPTAGRDGGIDFVAPWADGRLVGDFKCLSEDGLRPAQREWHVVADRLAKHLASAAGPTSGQSQYAPWYSVTDPIRAYRLCTSSHLKNLGQDGTLVTEIRAFFADLAARHAHLSHLRNLDVGIIDWSDLEILLSARPEIALRWFPALRPLGLTVLDDAVGPGRFREYLLTKKLKYYSRRDHHARFGGADAPMSEDDLLALIDYRTTTGLVITGPGGVGKTRLSLELGRRAEESDAAVVLRATRQVDLERLNDRLPKDSPLLILIDYAETQKDFDVLVSTLNDLTDQFELRVGWIATCRTSFYPQLEPLPRHVRFDLRDQSAIEGRTSEHDFNAAVVRHILEASGVGASADALRVCRSLPVLAVFLAYLIDHDRPLDLAELLGEQDFGSWVAHRIQLSFAGRTIGRELATLAAMLPLDAMAIDALTRDERDVFNRLAADGWIEREAAADRPGGEAWVAAHDVLADQVLLSYLRTILPTADTFVRELLKRAADIDALDSVVFSLQRIAAEIPRLPMHALLDRSMTESPNVWRLHRNVLIGTSLLSVKEQLRLLGGHPEVWADAEYDVGFQNRIGWLTRYASNSPGKAFSKEFKKEVDEELGQEERDILRAWLPRVAPRTTVSNFALTWGLRFAPDLVRESARRWIVTRPHVLQTHYLLVSWLEMGLPIEEIESAIAEWLTIDDNRNSEAAAHVYSAWLKATRDREFVESSIKEWLTHEPNTTTHNADWVYGAWLETNGDPATIQLQMLAWLGVYGLRRDADFVLRAWLDAGGAFSTVREHALAWFETYALEHNATYVLKFITKQRGLPIDINRKVLEWCRHFADDPDAIWRLSTITRHLGRESADEAVFTAHAVLQPILSRPTLDTVTHGQVASVLCDVVAMELRQHQRLSNVLCELIATWFNRADFFDALSSHAPHTQTREFLVAVRIAAGRQPRSASVEKILQWVDTWDDTRRAIASDVITPLRRSGTPDLSSEGSIPLDGLGGLLDVKIVAAALVDLLRADVVSPSIPKRAYVFASNTVAADPSATLTVLDALVAAVPDDAAYWNLLGIARRDVGLLPEALDAARYSTKLKPDVAGFWYSLGRICEDAGRFDESEAAFVEALRLKNGKYVKANIALERVRSRTSPRS